MNLATLAASEPCLNETKLGLVKNDFLPIFYPQIADLTLPTVLLCKTIDAKSRQPLDGTISGLVSRVTR
jgi:hypothetical protein